MSKEPTREDVASIIASASLPDRLRMAANMISSNEPAVVSFGRLIIETVLSKLPPRLP